MELRASKEKVDLSLFLIRKILNQEEKVNSNNQVKYFSSLLSKS